MKEFIKRFPKTDHPAAFGQHVNADITSLIEETNALLGTMVKRDDCLLMTVPLFFPRNMFHAMHMIAVTGTNPPRALCPLAPNRTT